MGRGGPRGPPHPRSRRSTPPRPPTRQRERPRGPRGVGRGAGAAGEDLCGAQQAAGVTRWSGPCSPPLSAVPLTPLPQSLLGMRAVPEPPAGPGSGRWAASGPGEGVLQLWPTRAWAAPPRAGCVHCGPCLHGATFWVSAATPLVALALPAPSAWARFMQTHLICLLSPRSNVVHGPAPFPKPLGPRTRGQRLRLLADFLPLQRPLVGGGSRSKEELAPEEPRG